MALIAPQWRALEITPLLGMLERAGVHARMVCTEALGSEEVRASLTRERGLYVDTRNLEDLRLLAELPVPKINTPSAIRHTVDRARALATARSVGAPTLPDYLGPLSGMPFEQFVLKTPRSLEATPRIKVARTPEQARALLDAISGDERVFAQPYLHAIEEHRIVLVGQQIFGFSHRPLLRADAPTARRAVSLDPEICACARAVTDALGLDIASVDILRAAGGDWYLTDINTTQDLRGFQAGYPSLVATLTSWLRR